ncbi:hypothetical protein J2Z83_003137 [Virgibacillus natechei]|uniref:Uncharacterized protein n=1 Tax=Virgibacillus natechei TaxID=1216297 RepID=A0ABS4IKB6_9BACI|nr:hypothetical protein [Virgibacillus natechei]MBP1971000.1 hypothetical protein [Virgibacillus natechei]UZD12761.1 hypothetical protein OLD84_18020 [Virgibacillus natechei]
MEMIGVRLIVSAFLCLGRARRVETGEGWAESGELRTKSGKKGRKPGERYTESGESHTNDAISGPGISLLRALRQRHFANLNLFSIENLHDVDFFLYNYPQVYYPQHIHNS